MQTQHHRGGSVISFHGNKSRIVFVKHQMFEPFSKLQDPLRSSDQEGPVSGEVLCCRKWALDAIFVKLASGCYGKRRGCFFFTRWQHMWNNFIVHYVSSSALWCEIWPMVLWQQAECWTGSDILILLVASFGSVAKSNEEIGVGLMFPDHIDDKDIESHLCNAACPIVSAQIIFCRRVAIVDQTIQRLP